MSFISPIRTDTNGKAIETGQLQSLGKDDFLKLLVSKLQNQDPLKPMDDESFVAELAQFSSLEQMNNIADGIAQQNQMSFLQSQGLNNVMASGLIGKEVKAHFSTINLNAGDKPAVNFTLGSAAADVTLTIKNAAGEVIRTLSAENLPAGAGQIIWDGKDNVGNRAPTGDYAASISAKTATGGSVSASLNLVGVVRQVVYRDGAAFLMINGVAVGLGDVLGIGEPGTFSEND
jgi:flagellar basal-body rod modification protein FlgD